MYLKRLKVENFKRFKTKEIEFGKGLIGIIGANGVGKSSIFEAIYFGLYGDNRNQRRKEYLINSNSNSKMRVELEFELNLKNYRVIREYIGKSLSPRAYLYESEKLIADGFRDVNGAIEQTLSMDAIAFSNSIFTSQKELSSLSELSNRERKEFIKRLFGLEKLDLIERELTKPNNIISNLKNELKEQNSILEDIPFDGVEFESIKIKTIKLRESLDRKKNEQKRLKSEIKSLNRELLNFKRLKSIKERLEREMISLQMEISVLTTEIEKLTKKASKIELIESEFRELKELEREYQSTLTSQRELLEIKDLNQEIQFLKQSLSNELKEERELKSKVEKFNSTEIDLKKLKDILNSKERELNSKEISNLNLKSEIDKVRGVINSIKTQIDRLSKSKELSSCPTCGQSIENFEDIIKSLEDKIEMHNCEILNYNSKIENLNPLKDTIKSYGKREESLKFELIRKDELLKSLDRLKIEPLKREIQSKESNLLKYSNIDIEKSLKELAIRVKTLESKHNRFIELKAQLENLKILKGELTSANSKRDNSISKLNSLKQELSLLSYNDMEHSRVEKIKESLGKSRDDIVEYILDTQKKLSISERELIELKSRRDKIESLNLKIAQVEQDILDYKKIREAIDNFKKEINLTLTPRISEVATSLLNRATSGKFQNLTIDSEFNFSIEDDSNSYPIQRFSGGEIDIANFALRVAISKVINELNSNHDISILAFDEIFGSQDESRREAILSLLNQLSREYQQIFVISHFEDVKESFEQVLEL